MSHETGGEAREVPEREVTLLTPANIEIEGQRIGYDSEERRRAITAHLARAGVSFHDPAIRMLLESLGTPVEENTPGDDIAHEQGNASQNRGLAKGD